MEELGERVFYFTPSLFFYLFMFWRVGGIRTPKNVSLSSGRLKERSRVGGGIFLLLWCVPEHSTTSIKGRCTTGVRRTLARIVIIEADTIIKSCDGGVAPPPRVYTQKLGWRGWWGGSSTPYQWL